MKRIAFLLALGITIGLALSAGFVAANVGSPMYVNSATNQAFPQQIPIVSANTNLSVATNTANVVLTVPAATTTGAGTVQFGTGAAQVCSGATCAAKQATLPAGTNGQALVYSAIGTGTTTNIQPKTLGESDISGLTTDLASKVPTTSAGVSVGSGLTLSGSLGTGTGIALGVGTGFVRTTDIGTTVEPNLTGPSGDFACYGGTATGTATATLVPCPAPTSTAVSVSFPAGVTGQALINATTSTSTGTTYTAQTLYESNIVSLVSDLSGKQASLGTASQGYILYAGSTSTATNSAGTPVWGPRPTMPVYTSMSLSTSARVSLTTATGTASSTATQALPSDAKVPVSSNAIIGVTTVTSTAASTATQVMPADAVIPLANISGRLIATTVYASAGVHYPTTNAQTKLVHIVGRAGGGGGGGAYSTCADISAAGGGGAQGGYFEWWVTVAGGGSSLIISVGGGASGGSGVGGDGATGGNTYTVYGATTVTAVGGGGGSGAVISGECVHTLAKGGRSYVGSNGTLQWAGASGTPGVYLGFFDGVAFAYSGYGGGEGGGAGDFTGPASLAGAGNGSGGSGAVSAVDGGGIGGAGADGWAKLEEYTN